MTTTRRLSLAYLALTAGVAVLFALNLFWGSVSLTPGAVAAALAARFGNVGGIVTAACMVLFAFATILAWFYIGDQALGWLMRDVPQKRADKICILYHGGYLASVFLGCVSRMEAVWAVSDIFNGLMAVPNLAALVLLGRKVRRPER